MICLFSKNQLLPHRYGTTRPPSGNPATHFVVGSRTKKDEKCDSPRILSIFPIFELISHSKVLPFGAEFAFVLPRRIRELVLGRWRWWRPSIVLCSGVESASQQVIDQFVSTPDAKNKKPHMSKKRKNGFFSCILQCLKYLFS